MSDGLYYYVCDNCGTFADISAKPHGEVVWACGECDSEALWEFTDKQKAWVHGEHIRNKRFAAQNGAARLALALASKRPSEPTSKVELTLNAKGDVQIGVDVTDTDPKKATDTASKLFDALRAKYPRENGDAK